MGSKSNKDIIAIAKAVECVKVLSEKYALQQFKPYDWQLDFYAAGTNHPQRMLCAANRVGKTLSAGVEVAFHATGEYPVWWPGVRFQHAPLIWALGVSGEQIRDVLQTLLFGFYDGRRFSGGLIRMDQVTSVLPASGTARLAKDVHIKHTKGDAVVSFKSYSQGQHAIMGSNIDVGWIDEEPQDPAIYPQVVTRTTLGNKGKGGLVLITETPELGLTELLIQYMDDRGPAQYFCNATWDDAPHLSEQIKADILSALPEYQREMRSKGIPVLGEGRVFTVAEDRFIIDPFEIPSHYFTLAAIDFGIDHPTAVVWVAEDRDTGIVYLIDEYSQSGELPSTHAAAIRKRRPCPVIYPHDGDNTEKGSGRTLAELYRDEELPMDVKFTNPDGTNYVEPGLMDVLARLREGRLKVFSTCTNWLREYRRYHRKNGKIVKLDDDLMDATRYAVVSVGRYGAQGSTRTGRTPWDQPLNYRT